MCGGCSKVGTYLNVTRITVWRWQNEGFPPSEYAERTHYTAGIAQLCQQAGFNVSAKQILNDSKIIK